MKEVIKKKFRTTEISQNQSSVTEEQPITRKKVKKHTPSTKGEKLKKSPFPLHNLIIKPQTIPKGDVSIDLEERLEKGLRSIKKQKNLVLVDILGEGGQGIVAKMYCNDLKTFVAIKISVTNPLGAQNEQKSMQLIHESGKDELIKVYENETFKKLGFLKMECGVVSVLDFLDYFEAKSLNLDASDSLFICKSVLEQARVLRSLNIYNRDIKLENFIITEEGKVKVIDFDLSAISLNPIAEKVAPVGTAKYWHPDLAAAQKKKELLEKFDYWKGELFTVYRTCMFLLKHTEKTPEVEALLKIRSKDFETIEEALDEIKIDKTKLEVDDEIVAYVIRYKMNDGININPLRVVNVLDKLEKKSECLLWVREIKKYLRHRNLEFPSYYSFYMDLAYLTAIEYKLNSNDENINCDKFGIIDFYNRHYDRKVRLEVFFDKHRPYFESLKSELLIDKPLEFVERGRKEKNQIDANFDYDKIIELSLACAKALFINDSGIVDPIILIDTLAQEYYNNNLYQMAMMNLEISLELKKELVPHSETRIKDTYWAMANCSTKLSDALDYAIKGYEAIQSKTEELSSYFNEMLGDQYFKFGDPEMAASHYDYSKTLISQSPGHEDQFFRVLLKKAHAHLDLYDEAQAFSCCHKALKINPKLLGNLSILKKYSHILINYLEEIGVSPPLLENMISYVEMEELEEKERSEEEKEPSLKFDVENLNNESSKSSEVLDDEFKAKKSPDMRDSMIEVF